MNLTWNDASTEESKKRVFVLAESAMPAEPGKFVELREVPGVVAVAVPFGNSGYKVYNMRDDGKMVRCGKSKIWPSLVAVKAYFENR